MKTKTLFLNLVLFATLGAPAAHAADCLFGSNTGDLDSLMEQKILHRGATKKATLRKLTAIERDMIVDAVTGEDDHSYTEDEAAKIFTSEDGYIQYFSNDETGETYAAVTFYPTANEYGVIVKFISPEHRAQKFKVVAIVNAGDFQLCSEYK